MAEAEVLEAGRDLDKLIAERVMGWVYDLIDPKLGYTNVSAWFSKDKPGRYPTDVIQSEAPRFSTDIAAAWEVVKAVRNGCTFSLTMGKEGFFANFGPGTYSKADDGALAICLAALKAMEEPAHA